MKIQAEVRDHLARVAARDLRRDISTAYARLRENQPEWDAYVAELDEWDAVSADSAEFAAETL